MESFETLPARIAAKIDRTDSCWLWTGGRRREYGTVYASDARRNLPAHRVVYELLVGPIPEGLELDHLCRMPPCVNPAHLEPVTHRENTLRGETVAARAAAATSCPADHPYDGDNLYVDPNGERRCRACHRDRQAARRAADLEASREASRRYGAAQRARGYVRPSRRKAS